MKFSIVIPTYNRASKIPELLNSLKQQTFSDFEIVIVDDGSTDNTQELVEQLGGDLNIKYIYSENWGGPARPRNIGIENASAEWVCFLDSDDIWYPSKLAECFHTIKDYPEVGLIFSNVAFVHNGLFNKTIGYYRPVSNTLGNFKKLVYEGNKIVLSSICVKKSLLQDVGGFSENRDLIGVEDFDLLLKLAFSDIKFYGIRKTLVEYRIFSDNISGNEQLQIEKNMKLLYSYAEAHPHLISHRKLRSLHFYMLGNYYKKIELDKEAKTFYYKAATNCLNSTIGVKSLTKLLF